MIKFFIQLKTNPYRFVHAPSIVLTSRSSFSSSATEKAMTFVQILIISVTLVVVAVPEG